MLTSKDFEKSSKSNTTIGDRSIIPTWKIGLLKGSRMGSVKSVKNILIFPAPGDLIQESKMRAMIAKLVRSNKMLMNETMNTRIWDM